MKNLRRLLKEYIGTTEFKTTRLSQLISLAPSKTSYKNFKSEFSFKNGARRNSIVFAIKFSQGKKGIYYTFTSE